MQLFHYPLGVYRLPEVYKWFCSYFKFLTPVNGKQASTLFSTRLKGISAWLLL